VRLTAAGMDMSDDLYSPKRAFSAMEQLTPLTQLKAAGEATALVSDRPDIDWGAGHERG
jgi:hypothetical protein